MIAIVVPNWNGIDFLSACLDSLLAQDYSRAKIVVVDNGSADGSVEFLQQNYPQIHLIKLDKNYGFAGGVNRGISYAIDHGFEFVALFNNDAVADKSWLTSLVSTAEATPSAGIITSKFLKLEDGTIDSTGDFYSVWGLPFPRGRGEKDAGQYDKTEGVFGASGGASLYRISMLQKIGLFDEDFFAYYEDVDLSFRAQLAGWKVLYEPKAIAHHHIGGTSAKLGDFARFHSFKNVVYLYTKNMPGWLYWKYLPKVFVGFALMVAHDLSRGRLAPLAKALVQIVIKFPAMIAKRWHIQHARRADIKYIDSILYHRMSPLSLTSFRRRFKKLAP